MTIKEALESVEKDGGTWDMVACEMVCEAAGMADAWAAADGDSYETVVYEAAEKLRAEMLKED